MQFIRLRENILANLLDNDDGSICELFGANVPFHNADNKIEKGLESLSDCASLLS